VRRTRQRNHPERALRDHAGLRPCRAPDRRRHLRARDPRRPELARVARDCAILGGVGAALAGTSFQAFSYELKCAGRERCLSTNGFEIGYNLAQAASVSAMLIAVAYACTTRGLRRALIAYSIVNVIAYCVVSATGVGLTARFLHSFDMLMLFALLRGSGSSSPLSRTTATTRPTARRRSGKVGGASTSRRTTSCTSASSARSPMW